VALLYCYAVTLETTDCLQGTARVGDQYVSVEGGTLHMIALDAAEVTRVFPKALNIRCIGIGYRAKDPQ